MPCALEKCGTRTSRNRRTVDRRQKRRAPWWSRVRLVQAQQQVARTAHRSNSKRKKDEHEKQTCKEKKEGREEKEEKEACDPAISEGRSEGVRELRRDVRDGQERVKVIQT